MSRKAAFILLIGALSLSFAMLPRSLRADTFTYTSKPYADCVLTYCLGGPYAETLTFSTTLTGAALDNLTNYAIPMADVTSFDFTDTKGLSLTQADELDPGFTDLFQISTDGSGNIIAWAINASLVTQIAPLQEEIKLAETVYGGEDSSGDYEVISGSLAGGGYGASGPANGNINSSWTNVTGIVSTPEPSSLLLLTCGMLALGMLGGWQRRRGTNLPLG